MTKKKNTIIIADDDKGISEALTFILEDVGYQVKVVNRDNIIQKIQENMPQLLLLDIWISGVNGKDVCKKLKSQENTKNIPVIMFSANTDIEKIAREAGADDFLKKPFEMNELLSKIAQHIS